MDIWTCCDTDGTDGAHVRLPSFSFGCTITPTHWPFRQFKPWLLATLLEWHNKFTLTAFETRRNDIVFGIQGNRNPFVDFPDWVQKVYGA